MQNAWWWIIAIGMHGVALYGTTVVHEERFAPVDEPGVAIVTLLPVLPGRAAIRELPRAATLVRWETSLEAALARAVKEGKPVLLHQLVGDMDKEGC